MKALPRVLLAALIVGAGVTAQPAADGGRLAFTRVRGSGAGGAVLDLGDGKAFDADWVACPSVVFDGKQYRMWYSSLYDSKMGRGGIGLATSADGVRWERANGGKPVLEVGPPGAFDEGQVMGPEVHFDGKLYRMWYTGMAAQWHASGLGFYRIGLAVSTDGLRWERANGGKPVLDVGPAGSPDEVQAATPSMLKEGDGYRMWYAAWAPKHGHTICVARSRDGLHWERENEGKPVAGLVPPGAYGPAVGRLGGRYVMLSMASQAPPGLYAAESADGLRWTSLNASKPVLLPGEPADFDGHVVGHPCILRGSDRLRVWYTGYRREKDGIRGMRLRIGLAEAPVTTNPP